MIATIQCYHIMGIVSSIRKTYYELIQTYEETMRTRLKVKEIAEAKGITMTKLSRISDVNYKTIHAIFNNPERDVEYRTLLKLSKALSVSIPDLVEELPDETI